VTEPGDIVIAEALWAKVVDDLSEDAAYATYLQHCQDAELLPDAAQRFQQIKAELDDDDAQRELIDKRLAGIALVALSKLDGQRIDPKPATVKQFLTFIIVLLALSAVVGFIKALLL
jgi:hypothetical protein